MTNLAAAMVVTIALLHRRVMVLENSIKILIVLILMLLAETVN